MLKKCISLAIVCTMLAGLFVPSYAADSAKTYAEYVMTDNVALNQTGFTANAHVARFYPGDSLAGKSGDVVYEVTSRGSGIPFSVGKTNIGETYTDGEKVHVSTEIMVASGSTFREPRLGGPGLSLSVLTSPDSTSSKGSVGVSGVVKAPNQYGVGKIITFDHGGRITLFGGSIHTNMNWSFDRWYKLDVALVMGAKPKVAIYVDGQPLAIDVDYGNGVQISSNNAAFDGIKTTTDYIDAGSLTTNGFAACGIYGINSFAVDGLTYADANAKATVYVDNMFCKAMSSSDYPAIDSDLGFKGLFDGATIDRADLNSVEISVPAWFAYKTAKVALSVDGASALEDASAPFIFDLSGAERGVRHLTLTAYDANGNIIKEAVRSLTVAGNEVKEIFCNDFEAPAPFDARPYGGILWSACKPRNANEMTDDRKITFENVTDSAATVKRAAKLYSKDTNKMEIGYKNETTPTPTTGTVNMSYDMYIDNDNIGLLSFCRISSGYPIISYADGKFKTSTDSTYGLGSEVSFDAKTGYWQNWQWTFDFERKNVSLIVDGETKLSRVSMKSDWLSRECTGFCLCFNNSGTDTGNFVAVDNFSVIRYTGIPAIKYDMYDYNNNKSWSDYSLSTMYNLGIASDRIVEPKGDNSNIYAGVVMNAEGTAPLNASFGDSIIGEFSSKDAYTSAAFTIPFTYSRGPYTQGYGNTTVEFDFYLDNLNHGGITFAYDSTQVAYMEAGSGLIKILGGTSTGYSVTPGEWHRYKFVAEYSISTKPYIGMYVDDVRVYYGAPGYTFGRHNDSKLSYFKWTMTSVADSADSTKYAANKIAIDNICFEFEPVTPYISSVDFGAENYADGFVKASVTTADAKVNGMGLTLDTVAAKIKVIDVSEGNVMENVSVSASADSGRADVVNVSISNLTLEAGKQYKIILDSGVNFEYKNYFVTNEPSSFIFTAVDSLPADAVADDGVDGSITVADVRFTTNSPLPLAAGALKGYAGGTIESGKELRADVMVNNSSSAAQTFRVALATYEGSELTGISVSNEYTVPAKAQSMVFTSGKIDIAAASAPDIKVMILTDVTAIVPVSRAFSLDN